MESATPIIFSEAFSAAQPPPPFPVHKRHWQFLNLDCVPRCAGGSTQPLPVQSKGVLAATKQPGNLKPEVEGSSACTSISIACAAHTWLNGDFGAEGVQNVRGSGGGSGDGGSSSWGPSRGRSGYAGAAATGSGSGVPSNACPEHCDK